MNSKAFKVSDITLPRFTGVRVMMMPFLLHHPLTTLPNYLGQWVDVIDAALGGYLYGVGYLTVDEALVKAGETHRRPGPHVDGIGPDGGHGGWGSGGGYGASGMYMASSHVGCRVWLGEIPGEPGPDGDCSHLELDPDAAQILQPRSLWWCDSLCVHEAIPMAEDTKRQFMRISMPSTCPWYEGYTENPLGIQPTGPIHARRSGMEYRP